MNDPILKKAEDVQIMSDSNIDILNYKHHGHTNTYVETLLNNNLLPLVTLPTRVTPTTATIIDHISTSHKADNYTSGIIHSSLSDHLPVFYMRQSQSCRQPPQYTKSRKITPTTIPIFGDLLKTTSFESVTDENRPKHAFDNFFEILDGAVNKVLPETVTKVHKSNSPLNPWMTTGLLTSRKQKEKLASKKLRNPTLLNINNFKSFNKIYNSLIRKEKHSHYDSKFTEFSTNMKKTWETIREVIGTKKHRENIPDFFKQNGNIITGALEIAEGFNSFLLVLALS